MSLYAALISKIIPGEESPWQDAIDEPLEAILAIA